MLFSRVYSILVFLTLSILAAASNIPLEARGGTKPTVTVTVTAPASTVTAPAGSCNTGPVQCCQSTSTTSNPSTSLLLGLLGVVVSGVDVLVGLNCSPITVIGVGSACGSNAVCCQNNNFNGLISIGCIPITL